MALLLLVNGTTGVLIKVLLGHLLRHGLMVVSGTSLVRKNKRVQQPIQTERAQDGMEREIGPLQPEEWSEGTDTRHRGQTPGKEESSLLLALKGMRWPLGINKVTATLFMDLFPYKEQN